MRVLVYDKVRADLRFRAVPPCHFLDAFQVLRASLNMIPSGLGPFSAGDHHHVAGSRVGGKKLPELGMEGRFKAEDTAGGQKLPQSEEETR